MASRSSAARKAAGVKSRITTRQKSARRKNIAVARASKKKGMARGTKSRPTSAKMASGAKSQGGMPLTKKQRSSVKKIQAKFRKGKEVESRRRRVPGHKISGFARKKQASLNKLFKKYKKGGMIDKKMGAKIDRMQRSVSKLSKWYTKNTGRSLRI